MNPFETLIPVFILGCIIVVQARLGTSCYQAKFRNCIQSTTVQSSVGNTQKFHPHYAIGSRYFCLLHSALITCYDSPFSTLQNGFLFACPAVFYWWPTFGGSSRWSALGELSLFRSNLLWLFGALVNAFALLPSLPYYLQWSLSLKREIYLHMKNNLWITKIWSLLQIPGWLSW